MSGSGFGEDLFGSDPVDSIDCASADQPTVIPDRVFGGARRVAPGTLDGGPGGHERVTSEPSSAVKDGPGDDPLDLELVASWPGVDGDTPGVLNTIGVDAVDHVSADNTRALAELSSGQAASDDEGGDEEYGGQPQDDGESKNTMSRLMRSLIGIGLVALLSVIAFAVFEPVQVLPRIRVAPGYSLVDQSGVPYSSEEARGSVILYTFLPTKCDEECRSAVETVDEVNRRVAEDVDLGGVDFLSLTVALDTDDPEALAAAAGASGADGAQWRWLTAQTSVVRDVVGDGFRVYFEENSDGSISYDPVFVIVGPTGLIRGDYRYTTLVSDADRLTRHISLLGNEIRNSHGAASVIFEAAHLFLCYP